MHVILIHAYLFDPKKLGGITLGGDYKYRSPYLNSIVPQSRWGTISQIRIQVLVDVFENEVKGHFSLAPLSMRDIKQSEERANYCCNKLLAI